MLRFLLMVQPAPIEKAEDPRALYHLRNCQRYIRIMRDEAELCRQASIRAGEVSNRCDDGFLYRLTRYYAYESNRIHEAALFDAALYERLQCQGGLNPLMHAIKVIRRTIADTKEATQAGTSF